MTSPVGDAAPSTGNAMKFLKTPAGLAVVGAAGLALYLYWTRRPTGEPVVDESTPDGGYVSTDREPGGEADGDVLTPRTPQTNEEWKSVAINWLTSRGVDAAAAQTAIEKFIAGESLTTAQKALVALALTAWGNPPAGAPPIITDPPVTPPVTPPSNAGKYPVGPNGVRPNASRTIPTVRGQTWTTLVNLYFPAGSTNVRALKQWHITHGGNPVANGIYTFGTGTKIVLPVTSPGIL